MTLSREFDLTIPISVLDNRRVPAKNTGNSGEEQFAAPAKRRRPESMTTSRPAQPSVNSNDVAPCKHPRVRVVAREEDAEFVECLECGEVFESSEFRDIEIENTKLAND